MPRAHAASTMVGMDQTRGTVAPVAHVLVVEDDRDIADSIELYLRHDGHRTDRAHDGRQALDLFHHANPDLVVLDIGLPVVDGLEVLRSIRSRSEVPVIVVTARREELDELLGLALGADDYVTKPFNPRTLLARVKAVLRRSEPSRALPRVTRLGGLEIDRDRAEVRVDTATVSLTPTEYKLLAALADAPTMVLRRDQLIERAMPESDALERTVDGHMKNLRHKLAEAGAGDVIETVRGIGYRLRRAGD
jgi:two-component system, OmpR family, response regulator AdeR